LAVFGPVTVIIAGISPGVSGFWHARGMLNLLL
jgi:hypothetical protein